MTTPAMTDQDRELFEAWAELTAAQKMGAQHDLAGWHYFDDDTEIRWEAWQAARALPQQVVAAGSIDSPEFNDLLYLFGRAFIAGTHEQVVAAGNALVAYIDARQPAPVKPEGQGDADKLRRLREGMDKWGWCAEFGALAMDVLREPSAPVSAADVATGGAVAVDRQSCLLVADDILKLYFLPITGYVLKQKIADAVYEAIKNNPCAAAAPAMPGAAQQAAQQQAATVPYGALELAINPRRWTREMDQAWHRNIPDLYAAFDALRAAAIRAAATTDGRDEE